MTSEPRIDNLFGDQISLMTRLWSQAIQIHYPESVHMWRDPVIHLEVMNQTLLGAVKKLDWSRFLGNTGVTVLDLGGTGWLSAFLSKYACVNRIDALDSDRNHLELMLPKITELLGGDFSRIRPYLGLMDPLPFPDEAYDVVVASSSIHHTSHLFSALSGLRRVLRRDGVLMLLNETPRTFDEYLVYSLGIIHLLLDRVCRRSSTEFQVSLGANGILYDPKLGDTAFAFHQYPNALTHAGLRCGIIRAGVYKGPPDPAGGDELVHFICVRSDGDRDILALGGRQISALEMETATPPTLDRAEKVMKAVYGG